MQDLNSLPLDALYAELGRTGLVRALLNLARDEDLGPARRDVSTECMGIGAVAAAAALRARQAGAMAGLAAIDDLIGVMAPHVRWEATSRDGDGFAAGDVLARFTGPAGELLALERTMLNLLSRLSGVATLTRRFVAAAANPRVRVLDTRKTTPGLRVLEKYAVRCGGGFCHRLGLHDAALIKDNHLAASGGADLRARLADAARRARAMRSVRFVEAEVDTLEQLDAALRVERGLIDIILLDNMDERTLREAVRRRDAARGPLLEASGGVTLETIGAIARTGVERISVGALTHQAVSVDLGLDFEPAPGRPLSP